MHERILKDNYRPSFLPIMIMYVICVNAQSQHRQQVKDAPRTQSVNYDRWLQPTALVLVLLFAFASPTNESG